jgi:hypothetical protein
MRARADGHSSTPIFQGLFQHPRLRLVGARLCFTSAALLRVSGVFRCQLRPLGARPENESFLFHASAAGSRTPLDVRGSGEVRTYTASLSLTVRIVCVPQASQT